MLSEEEKKRALQGLKDLKVDISKVKAELNELDAQKESWFEKKKAVSKEIIALITEITAFKAKRDEFTAKVKELKAEREEKNSKVKEISAEIKKLNEQKEEFSKKAPLDFDPVKIKASIDALERKIETEGVSFSKEKVMMKQIKELKKKFDESKDLVTTMNNVRELNKQVSKERKIAEKIHNSLQEAAKESHAMHEKILENSKKIDELRVKEKEADAEFVKFKSEFTEKHAAYKELSDKINDINSQLGQDREEIREVIKEQKEKELSKMSKGVEEKIKKRQKLTTEDILVFQAKMGKE